MDEHSPRGGGRRGRKHVLVREYVRSVIVSAEPGTPAPSERDLAERRVEPTPVEIGLAVASLVTMPDLSWAQRRTGTALGSNAVVADSTQTLLCTYLSAVLLVGLLLTSTLGWGWADPVAGLVIAAIAAREGAQAWRGEGCCASSGVGDAEEAACRCGADGCAEGCCS